MKLEDNLNDISRISDMLKLGPVAADMVTSLCGEFIGSGSYRSVFEYQLDSKYVIKVEPLNTQCNLIEYQLWEEIKGLCGDLDFVPKWFAPVKWISPGGRLLVMEKTIQKDIEKPKVVPEFLWDIKADNFGWIGNKFVCHDYGSSFHAFTNYSKRKIKAYW